jgi:hypothetical protein
MDQALAIVEGRAQIAASEAGTTTEFFMTQMNYQALVLDVRVTLESGCKSCGQFVNEPDIWFDYILPLRHATDWARLHARNVYVMCASCHKAKGTKAHVAWLDEQWGLQSN